MRSPVEPICFDYSASHARQSNRVLPAGNPLILPPKRSLTSGNLRDQSKYPQEHSSGQCIRGRDGGGASTGIAIICNYTGSANLE